jgi:hypothetical protein
MLDNSSTNETSAPSALMEAGGNASHNLEDLAGMQQTFALYKYHNFILSFVSGWTLIEYSDEAWVKYMWFVYIFGLIWCSEFILSCQQMVISSSVSTWYFSR